MVRAGKSRIILGVDSDAQGAFHDSQHCLGACFDFCPRRYSFKIAVSQADAGNTAPTRLRQKEGLLSAEAGLADFCHRHSGGASEAREPGIHNPPALWIPGLRIPESRINCISARCHAPSYGPPCAVVRNRDDIRGRPGGSRRGRIPSGRRPAGAGFEPGPVRGPPLRALVAVAPGGRRFARPPLFAFIIVMRTEPEAQVILAQCSPSALNPVGQISGQTRAGLALTARAHRGLRA